MNLRAWAPRVAPWLIALAAIALVLIVRAAVVPAPLDRFAAAPSVAGDPPGTRAFTGALFVPRGGPTRIGFASPGPATLTVEGLAAPIAGRGVRTERVVLSRGAVAIRFAAPPGARLVWHPAGRTGDPEYVPASSLAPQPPRAARFDHPGAARGDALAAWLVVLIVIATALWSGRAALVALPRDALWWRRRCSRWRRSRGCGTSARPARPGTRTPTGRPGATTSRTWCAATSTTPPGGGTTSTRR
jgi:hypothetical protein